MKTKTQKQNKTSKLGQTLLFLSIVTAIIVFTLTDDSASSKYKIGAGSMEDKSGYEVSYINLTGKKTIDEKKIKLSEGYWTSGRFNF